MNFNYYLSEIETIRSTLNPLAITIDFYEDHYFITAKVKIFGETPYYISTGFFDLNGHSFDCSVEVIENGIKCTHIEFDNKQSLVDTLNEAIDRIIAEQE